MSVVLVSPLKTRKKDGKDKSVLAATMPLSKCSIFKSGEIFGISEDGSKVFAWNEEDLDISSSAKKKKKKKKKKSEGEAIGFSHEMDFGKHPVLDILFDQEKLIVARLVAGKPLIFR